MRSSSLLALVLVAGCLVAGCYASHDPLGDGGVSAVTSPCPSPGGGSRRDCGFRIERIESCAPGETLTVGCGCEGLGACSGDPVLRVCEGARACTVLEAIDNVDDRCGLCPSITFACPEAGRYSVLSAPYGSSSYTCTVDLRAGG